MNRAIIFSFILSFCIASTIQAQTLNHHLGEFLVKSNHPIEKVVEPFQEFQGERTQLKLKKIVSNEFNIYLLQFDFGVIHEERFLQELRRSPLVEVAQYNHILSNRAVPNDSQFNSQWQYINTGQSGGTSGADIDMDLAWDVTTGGVTALGDTIVAAIIDDGFDWTHQDFGDNVWVNYDEIPNDGIDNDNNGYVDDYRGWNAYTNDDNINGGGHGTPVTGIVGAQGNNNLGVAGVNWDVKLMIIQGGGGEAEALAAYSYCYTQRKRYNETGGAEGAYVVTTNASWGVDFGQPADAPLWCAFYDTLGVQGIVSCGATINGNQNVDVVGDLPTACPSDYLISVTNMNDDDVKVNGAGYGAVTIDLGAFGQDTWTTAANNSYGGFGGTSGATPHVTGTVALMHAAPCPSFAAYAKADPAGSALLIKQYILDGTDPNASLVGITTTEGRLNANNAVSAIITNCDPNGCFVPYAINDQNTTDVQSDIAWGQGDDTDQVDMRYKEIGTNTWINLANVTSPYNLTGLMPCTDYEYQLIAICGTDSTSWSTTYILETDGCCEPPSSITIDNISDNSAEVTWNAVLAAISYDLRYKEVSASTWIDVNTTNTNYSLIGLEGCTSYDVQVRTNCAGGVNTIYSSFVNFTTTGCGMCVDGDYCSSSSAEASFEWLERVEFNTIDNLSGANGGYANFTNFSTDVQSGLSYDITLTPGFDGYSYSEYFMVWIDYNQDGDFDDANEIAYDPGATTEVAITGTILIPATATEGPTRMRISQRWNNPAMPCDDGYDYGEVEDYCVNIMGGVSPVCTSPTNIIASNATDTSFDLDWDDMGDALGYEIRYKKTSDSIWEGSTSSSSNTTLTNLQECREYEFQIKTICTSTVSDFSNTQLHNTTCTSSVSDLNALSFNVQPNPVANNLMINFEGNNDWSFYLMDVSGRIIQTGQSNTDRYSLSMSEIPSGIYFIQIEKEGKRGIQKIVKL